MFSLVRLVLVSIENEFYKVELQAVSSCHMCLFYPIINRFVTLILYKWRGKLISEQEWDTSVVCLKSVRRGCHIWPRIRWRETFIAPATSFSLFLSLLWAIQDPKQQSKQCCTFRLQVFTLFKKKQKKNQWTNRLPWLCQSNCVWTYIFNNCIDYFIGIYYGMLWKPKLMSIMLSKMNMLGFYFAFSWNSCDFWKNKTLAVFKRVNCTKSQFILLITENWDRGTRVFYNIINVDLYAFRARHISSRFALYIYKTPLSKFQTHNFLLR